MAGAKGEDRRAEPPEERARTPKPSTFKGFNLPEKGMA
jgi:hypothetical protein